MGIEPLEDVDPDQLLALSDQLRKLANRIAGESEPERSPDAPPMSAAIVRSIIRARRLRAQMVDDRIFADPAWDMLLDLYAAHLEGMKVSVSSLCLAAGVPPTTALRWIKILENRGYVERSADTIDGRRIHLHLSDETVPKMEELLRASYQLAGVVL